MEFQRTVSTLLTFPFFLVVVGIKLSFVTLLIWRWHFPLSRIPGPRAAACTRLWWIKTLYLGRNAQELVRVHQNYGSIVRIAPNTIVISDLQVMRKVLATGSKYARGPWFDSLRIDPNITNVVSERNPHRHQRLRLMLSAGLSGKDVSNFEEVIDEHVRAWMQILGEKQGSQDDAAIRMDLSRMLPFLTMDIITHLCLGEPFRNLEKDRDQYGLLDALQSGMIAQQYIASLPEVKSLLFWLSSLPGLRSRIFPNVNNPTGIGKAMHVIRKTVELRISKGEKQESSNDMLDSFLARGLTLDQAASELLVVLSSGVGTTSYVMQGTILGIIGNPLICAKLQDEIDAVVRNLGVGSDDCAKDSILRKMPYLQACISEGLRMYPPIFQLRESVVPAGGDVLQGYPIPGGTFVAINGLSGQFHPVYGTNLESFEPERWLSNDEARLKEMHQNLELAFGHGSSKCLGINLANMELNKVVFKLFHKYSLELANPAHPWTARGDFILSNFNVVAMPRHRHRIVNGHSLH